MRLKQPLGTLFLALAAVTLVLALMVSLTTNSAPVSLAAVSSGDADAMPDSSAGTVNLHNDPGEPSPIDKNEPKVCLFHLHGFYFKPFNSVVWQIATQPGNVVMLSGTEVAGTDGTFKTRQYNLPNGMYKLYWREQGATIKHKVFTVDCPTPTPTNTPTATPTSTPEWQELPSPTPTSTLVPTATPTPRSGPRSDVGVLCQGCWSNQAILWVGGTEQPPLTFVPNHDGWPAVHWVLWHSEPWVLRIKVTMPAGLDPNRWRLLLWVGDGPDDYIWTDEVSVTIQPGENLFYDFQLVDLYFWN